MPEIPRYLTQIRFKLACECPAQLYYTRKLEYLDKKNTGPFMLSIAEGGSQVGQLESVAVAMVFESRRQ